MAAAALRKPEPHAPAALPSRPADRAKPAKSAKAFRSIGEVAGETGLAPHVIRYWQQRFPAFIRPVQRKDGRRLFRPRDIEAVRAVKLLVKDSGMTLKGAKAVLKDQGVGSVLAGQAFLRAAPVTVREAARPSDQPHGSRDARALQAFVAGAFPKEAPAPRASLEEAADHAKTDELDDVLARLAAVKKKLAASRSAGR